MRSNPLASLVVALVVAVGSGCSSFPEPERAFPGTEPVATVVVDNFASDFAGMVIFISSTTGSSDRLGSVSTTGTSRFQVRDVRHGEYYLEGRRAGLPALRSSTFLLGGGNTVEWNLDDNRISYR